RHRRHAEGHRRVDARAMRQQAIVTKDAAGFRRRWLFGGNRSLERGSAAYERGAYVEAFYAWKQASRRGSAAAAFEIGQLYVRGQGVLRSLPDAAAWFEKAAAAGHLQAQLQLGLMLLQGTGQHEGAHWKNWQSAASKKSGADAAIADAIFPNGLSID